MSFLSNLFKDVTDFGAMWKGAKRFAKKHPIATTVLVVGAGIGIAAMAGAFTPAVAALGTSAPSLAAPAYSSAIPGLTATIPGTAIPSVATGVAGATGTGVAAPLGASIPSLVAPGYIPAGEAGVGFLSRAGNFFGGTPTRLMASAIGAQTIGGYLSAQAAAEEAARQAEEDRAFQREMFGLQKGAAEEARRVTYTPYRAPAFVPRGRIQAATPAAPVRLTAPEANKLRKAGRL